MDFLTLYLQELKTNGFYIERNKAKEHCSKENDTYDIISEKMSKLGAKLLKQTLPDIFNQTAPRIKQDHNKKTLAPVIKKEDEHIDFNNRQEIVHNKIRALSSTPGTYALLENNRIKILLSEKT